MKYHILLAVALGALSTITASAQRPGGRPGGPPPFVTELPARYTALASFDVDADKKLDAEEQAELASAIASGEFTKPPGFGGPPEGVNPTAEQVATRLAKVYERLAAFDANNDGKLDEKEQAKLREGIISGKVTPPWVDPERGGKGRRGR